MKKHGLFTLAILMVFAVACLSMPVMAEKLIQDAQDKVMTQQATSDNSADSQPAVDAEIVRRRVVAQEALGVDSRPAAAAADTEIVRPDLTADEQALLAEKKAVRAELVGLPVSDAAMAAFEIAARDAYADTFGESIPESYKAVKADAYEEDGDVRFVLSLMPKNWEESTDTLTRQEKQPYFVISFGGVDVQTGTGNVIGLQRFWLGWDETAEEVNYSDEQLQAMEESARRFAGDHGFEAGDRLSVDKVSGSYDPGCVMEFALTDGKTLSVTVATDGSVSGYSLVPGKG